MEYLKKIFFVIVFLGFSFFSEAQEVSMSKDVEVSESKNDLLSMQNDQLPQIENHYFTQQKTNTVFIKQVGIDNQVSSNVNAQSSDFVLIQNGNSNFIVIDENSKESSKLISQQGNHNTVIDFSFNSELSTSLDLIQLGDHHRFERFGSNELSKNLKFRMSGEGKTIIIRSF